MSDQKNTLQKIDNAIEDVEKIYREFTDVLNTAKDDLISLEEKRKDLETGKDTLEQEKQKLEAQKIQLEAEKKELEQEKQKLEHDKEQLQEETVKLEREKQERDQKIGALNEEQMKLLEEYKKVKVELKNFMKVAEEAEEADYNFERVQALLSIYSVLVSEIWQGQPHYRVLMTLHGEKEKMTREELKNTTGIGGAFVLRAVHELAKVDLVEYNEDEGTVRLKKRLFEKQAIKEKE